MLENMDKDNASKEGKSFPPDRPLLKEEDLRDDLQGVREKPQREEELLGGRSLSRWIAQLFVAPLILVVCVILVYLMIRILTYDGMSVQDYLNEIRSGWGNQRWQAAYELARRLAGEDSQDLKQQLSPPLIGLFQQVPSDDPWVKRYLALALGRLEDPQVVPVLVAGLDSADLITQVYIVEALGHLKDPRALPSLLRLIREPEPELRRRAAYALGTIEDPQAVPALHEALNDRQVDVRWNAALALARFGDKTGLPILLQMVDRDCLDQIPGMKQEQKTQAMINAIRGLALLNESSTRPELVALSKSDPNLKVRQAALEALAKED